MVRQRRDPVGIGAGGLDPRGLDRLQAFAVA
jgi:hypothetical protein